MKGEVAIKVKQAWCLTSTETLRLIRDGEKGKGGTEVGGHHQNDFCIKMGSDESHFNVS